MFAQSWVNVACVGAAVSQHLDQPGSVMDSGRQGGGDPAPVIGCSTRSHDHRLWRGIFYETIAKKNMEPLSVSHPVDVRGGCFIPTILWPEWDISFFIKLPDI